MLKSRNLILLPPSQETYEPLRKVRPCNEFYRMVGSDPEDSLFINDDKFNKSYSESLSRENYWHVFKGINIIGIALLHDIDAVDRHARYAVGIYNDENWSKGYGYEITQCVLDYAFNILKLHKIDLHVLEYNKRAIASYKKNGFIQEGILRENAFLNNEWHNDIVMSILRDEFYNKQSTHAKKN